LVGLRTAQISSWRRKTSRRRKGQEDPLTGEEEDVLKAEELQESLENQISLVLDGL